MEQQQQQQTVQSQIRFLNSNVLHQLQQQPDVQAQQQPQVITLQNFMSVQAQQPQHDQQRAQAISVQSLPHQFLQVCKARNNIILFSKQYIAYACYTNFFFFHCALTCKHIMFHRVLKLLALRHKRLSSNSSSRVSNNHSSNMFSSSSNRNNNSSVIA